jgi:purine-binding chemotaxis protein CheW
MAPASPGILAGGQPAVPGLAGGTRAAPGLAAGGRPVALGVVAGGEPVALEAAAVAEVVRLPPVTRVPMAPPALAGLAAHRGRVLPVILLAELLGRPGGAKLARRMIVLAQAEPIGIAVDAVSGLRAEAAPLTLAPLLARAFAGMATPRAAPAPPLAPVTAPGPMAPAAAPVPEERRAILCFDLAGQAYGLPLEAVRAVLAAPATLLRLPGGDAALPGVMQHRGRPLPVLLPERLLGLPPTGRQAGRVVVTRLGGLLVDRVAGIEHLAAGRISPAPALLNRGGGEARIAGLARGDRGLVALLAPELLFRDAAAAAMPDDAEEEDAAMAPMAASEGILLFRLGTERYALPVAAVAEVIRYPAILTRVPRAPRFLAGIASHRGAALPVIEQRIRFGVPGEAPAAGRRVIVTRLDDVSVGFAVDAVEALRQVPAGSLAATPGLADGGGLFDRVAGLEAAGQPVLLVDPRALLDRAERDLVAAVLAGLSGAPA